MKALILTYDMVDDSEMLYPIYRLLEEGIRTDVASFEKRRLRSKYHYDFNADLLFEEVKVEDYAMLILPGGGAAEKVRQKMGALEITRYYMEKSLPVGAVCHGPQVLISAGVLRGRTATCYPGITDDLVNAGGIYVDREVVVDGNLVTSRRVEDLPYFMRELVKLVKKN